MTPATSQNRPDDALIGVMRLTLTPGLGPVLIGRLLSEFGGADAVLGATAARLRRVRGIGEVTAESIARGLAASGSLVDPELERAAALGVHLVARGSAGYPPLLDQLPDAPALLYVKGELRGGDQPEGGAGSDAYPLAIVGSRRCTAYGIEQAERFAGVLARAGLTIVSGGARGIDTAAHRGALRAAAGGRTIAVLGCGLAHVYPPENAELFERIAASGAVVSELPLQTPPTPDNFPARNRIISGLSLGVLVIEAGMRSGSLITARLAAEDHGREVMAIPGRVDSTASQGSLALLKEGGAQLVTNPGDVLAMLESPARHHHRGSHAARYEIQREPVMFGEAEEEESGGVEPGRGVAAERAEQADELGAAAPARAEEDGGAAGAREVGLTREQQGILGALAGPMTADALARAAGVPVHVLRAELTVLEMQRRVKREGAMLVRVR